MAGTVTLVLVLAVALLHEDVAVPVGQKAAKRIVAGLLCLAANLYDAAEQPLVGLAQVLEVDGLARLVLDGQRCLAHAFPSLPAATGRRPRSPHHKSSPIFQRGRPPEVWAV